MKLGRWGIALLTIAAATGLLSAQDVNVCDEAGDIPDVIVGELHEITRNGSASGITAYSVGTYSCNPGTCWLDWFEETTRHPVIGANMYRLKSGRFEQVGQSWLKHGFFALSTLLCHSDCNGTDGTHLGVHCADPYTAALNGQQGNLGPKYEVNPATGTFIFPFGTRNVSGNAIYKRLQVHNVDLDPDLNAGAEYYVEGTYLFPDDAPQPDGFPDGPDPDTLDDFDQVDNSANNTSYRKIKLTETSANVFDPSFSESTVRELPALYAWQAVDAGVLIESVVVPGDGRFFVASRGTDNGNGTWHYEYAIFNQTSNRAAAAVSVGLPFGTNVTNVGFHDVDYHSESTNGSGSYYDPTDWSNNGGQGSAVTWTMPPASPGKENALRWTTQYNFRFDADAPPADSTATLTLHLPGTPSSIEVHVIGPRQCDLDQVCDSGETAANCAPDCVDQGGAGGQCGDAVCDAGESPCTCLRDCGSADAEEFLCGNAADDDCDGLVDCADADCCADGACAGADSDGDGYELCDCNGANPNAWTVPGEVENLLLDHVPATGTTLTWDPPLEPGATLVTYEVIRSQNVTNFVGSTQCLPDGDLTDTTLLDASAAPASGRVYFYEVRAQNSCPAGEGPLGRSSSNIPREGRACP